MTSKYTPASLPRQLGAMTYDALLILAIWLVTLFPIVALTNNAATGPTVQSLLFLELVGFFMFFWYFKGQTLGMLAWKLTLISRSGQPLTPLQLIIRLAGALISMLCLGLGYWWILIDSERRSWSDMVSHTQVVHCT